MQRSSTQIKMIANMQHKELAHEALLSNLEAGVDYLKNRSSASSLDASSGITIINILDSVSRDSNGVPIRNNDGTYTPVPLTIFANGVYGPEAPTNFTVNSTVEFVRKIRAEGGSLDHNVTYEFIERGTVTAPNNANYPSQTLGFYYDAPQVN